MKISIITPTFNEIENIEKLYLEIKNEFSKIKCEYEHIIIDNNSTDGTINKIKDLSRNDKNLKIIINSKNYGHIRSPFYGLLQSTGDASILMAADFQDPIELISKYIEEWKKGKADRREENSPEIKVYKMLMLKVNDLADQMLLIVTL